MPSQKRLIISALLLFGAIAIGFFFVLPAYDQWKIVSRDLENARREYEYIREYYAELQKIRDRLRQYESALAKIDDAVPSRPSFPALFAYLQTVTTQNGLVLGELKTPTIGPSGKNPDLKEISMALPVSGSYDGFKSLLAALYRNSKLINVQSVSFGEAKKGEGREEQVEERAGEEEQTGEEVFDFEVVIKTYTR